jgi:hypothetical protein
MNPTKSDPCSVNTGHEVITGKRHRALRSTTLLAGAVAVTLGAWTGAAFAVSGGGYQPHQQGCQSGDSDFATPNGQTYPNCHTFAVNVESGGTTNGTPSEDNTRYASFGVDQLPNDPNSVGTPGLFSLAEPGMTGSPHAGCLAANTDGTGGGPAPAGSAPESSGTAENSTQGCGNNTQGDGFETNFDYYQFYCPIATMLSDPCEDSTPGTGSFNMDNGGASNFTPLMQDGLLLYLGADDNLDNGEHDGLGPFSLANNQNNYGSQNGSSDGGALMILLTPQTAANTPTASHPEGLLNFSEGQCADGICFGATTQQQTVYQGCGAPDSYGQAPCNSGTPQSANVYDYAPGGSTANDPSVNSESTNCNSGDANSTSEASCGSGGMNGIRSATPANENTEPGLQLYTDPDPQRSPAAPAPLWPTPALYVGTCGVFVGSPATTGAALGTTPQSVGPMEVVNSAGQVAVEPFPATC